MANTYTKIAAVNLTSGSASSMDFTSIPSTYTDLEILISARATSGGEDSITMKVNGLTTSIYSQKALEGNGASASSFSQSGINTAVRAGVIDGATDTASTFSSTSIYIPNYAGANNKVTSNATTPETNGTTAYMNLLAYQVATTGAITSISLYPNTGSFAQYSTATLYGISKS